MALGSSAWNIISNYEAHDIVRTRYFLKHGWTPNAAHSREITAPFIQARHYYNSAANADRTVKPLLLYYGVVSLSRGLVLFLTRELRDTALAQSHGLSVTDWQSVLKADRPDLGELRVTVNASGTFVDLLTATENRSLLRAGSSGVNHKSAEGPVTPGTVLTLGELLAGLPDVIDQFQCWKKPRCIRFTVVKIEDSPDSLITVARSQGAHVDEQLVMDIVGPNHCDLVSIDEKNVVVRTKSCGYYRGILTDKLDDYFAGIGHLYLAQRYASGARLAKIAQLFAISYMFGMLVRYHPAYETCARMAIAGWANL
jgi:hypothetical protein